MSEKKMLKDSKLIGEWNWDKNFDFDPGKLSIGSNKKVWWKCNKGHEWQAIISNRYKGRGCPICGNRQVLVGYNDLATICPTVAVEWHPDKNKPLAPSSVVFSSSKKVWWLCSFGHEWQAKIIDRIKENGTGCPYCSGRRAIPGVNDLVTLRPDMLEEWNYTRNTNISPSDISPGSGLSVWWVCKKGHEWKASINNRTKEKATGCPKCRQQYHTSFPEKAIAFYLKRVFPDTLENYHPDTFRGKELDIFIPSKSIAVEYDGAYAHKNIERDIEKDRLCVGAGIQLIHIREYECPDISDSPAIYYRLSKDKWTSLDDAIRFIFKALSAEPSFQIDNQADQAEIYDFMDIQEQEDSLATRNPELANEWHPVKNGVLRPDHVAAHSNVTVWWQCKKGHEWKAQINSRARGNGCPYCSGKIAILGMTDLQTTHPDLVADWDYEKNGALMPQDVTAGSERKVWWKGACGHTWQQMICTRTSGGGCPICAGIQLLVGYNDLQSKFPDIASEWNYEKNGSLMPTGVFANAKQTVWWKCEKGHEWQAAIYHRTGKDKTGCPVCSNRKLLKGYNDFETLYPALAKDWHPTLNGNLKPDDIISRSGKTVWWKCSYCGHEFQKKAVQRVLYPKCPICKK